MSDTYRLVARKGTWYYRRRVPDHLRVAIGRDVIQVSLGTKQKADAKRHRTMQDLEWDARFAALEQQGTDLTVKTSTTAIPLEDVVRDYVRRMDRKAASRELQHAPTDLHELQAARDNLQVELGILGDPADPRQDELVSHAWDQMLNEAQLPFEPAGSAREQFHAMVRRALIELCRRRLARVSDQFERSHFDDLFNPAHRREMSFGEMADDYLAARKHAAKLNKRDAKTIDKIITNVALVRELVGEATPVASIDHDICENFLKSLASTPSNRTKHYGKLTIAQVITQAAKDGKPALSPTTQGQYLTTFRDILERAARKRLISHNPANGLKPLVQAKLASHERRKPFTLKQLAQLFRCEFYESCAKSPGLVYADPRNTWRFWMPLFCLFMGMRPREVAQIELSDIRQTDAGTWFIDIAPAESQDEEVNCDAKGHKVKKSVKTAAGRRQVPLHPELIRLGLWNFVDRRRKATKHDPYLLPGLKPNMYGDRAAYALRRFNTSFLPKAIHVEDAQSFYSLRHSFRDALRRCNAPADTLQALGGWSQSPGSSAGKVTSSDYGDKTAADLQRAWIEKVSYPGLDLSHLVWPHSQCEPEGD